MAKDEPNRLVVETRSKSGIEGIGCNKWMVATWKVAIWPVVFLLGGMVATGVWDSELAEAVAFGCLFALAAYWMYYVFLLWVAGKEFWERVKDMEEPINLDAIH